MSAMKQLPVLLFLTTFLTYDIRRARAFVAPKPSTPNTSPLCLSIQHRSSTVSSATVRNQIERPKAQQIVDELLCPRTEERDRNSAGMQAFDTDTTDEYRGSVIENNDPRTQYTYGEFPFDSFDLLIDRALDFMKQTNAGSSSGDHKKNVMVDLGSGCGRLVFYAALARGNQREDTAPWDFHGIEIGSQLHSLAVNSLQRGVDNELFSLSPEDIEGAAALDTMSKIVLHNGNALLVEDPYFPIQSTTDGDSNESNISHESIQSLLAETTLLFAYSTVWETDSIQPFDPDIQAMVLSPKWSQTLTSLCPNGCVAVTTDRALNPRDGWKLLESMEVDNPSVWGSVGYISILEK